MENNEPKGKEGLPETVPLPATPAPIRTEYSTLLDEVEPKNKPINTNIYTEPPGRTEESYDAQKGAAAEYGIERGEEEREEPIEKEKTTPIIPSSIAHKFEVPSIKNIWHKYLVLRILVYILAAFSSIPVLTLLGWSVVTATIVIGIAGIGIAIAESCALGCGSCVCFPVVSVLMFVAFFGALLGGLGYCGYYIFVGMLALAGLSQGKNVRGGERATWLSQLGFERKMKDE
ncbi:1380_t:CDS:2 [Ambispora gerdemannii]|uniref:1380_t:CDS:1 n=1 Tax=Ambispora gerdemannii TaxID=144530 RepID=A0A9N8ZV49_9GLOM|nr:1380_t:CDS:2 [Ambispora gerdemannii]